MSYCRLGPDSDVYCYADMSGGWTTYGPDGHHNDADLPALKARLLAWREAGHQVPQYALDRIERELTENK